MLSLPLFFSFAMMTTRRTRSRVRKRRRRRKKQGVVAVGRQVLVQCCASLAPVLFSSRTTAWWPAARGGSHAPLALAARAMT